MKAMNAILTTARTTVCPMTVDDGAFLYVLMNSPGWLRFIGDRSIDSPDAAVTHIRAGYLKSYEDHGFGYYVIRDLETNQAMGICGFLQRPELDNPDFGFAMLPEFEGRGLAREACSAVFQYGTERFGFDTVDAITQADNSGSIRLLTALDFQLVNSGVEDGSESDLRLYRWNGIRRSPAVQAPCTRTSS